MTECVGMEFDWDALRPKQEYDNMSAYLAAKEDRIRELAKKRGLQERVPMEECSHDKPKPAKRTREDNTNLKWQVKIFLKELKFWWVQAKNLSHNN